MFAASFRLAIKRELLSLPLLPKVGAAAYLCFWLRDPIFSPVFLLLTAFAGGTLGFNDVAVAEPPLAYMASRPLARRSVLAAWLTARVLTATTMAISIAAFALWTWRSRGPLLPYVANTLRTRELIFSRILLEVAVFWCATIAAGLLKLSFATRDPRPLGQSRMGLAAKVASPVVFLTTCLLIVMAAVADGRGRASVLSYPCLSWAVGAVLLLAMSAAVRLRWERGDA